MVDYTDSQDMSELAQAVWDSRCRLEPFQKQVVELVKDFCGHSYGEEIHKDKQPVNQFALAVITYQHHLMSADPRVLCTTRRQDLETAAIEREAALNEWIIREQIGQVFNKAISAALFSAVGGVIKVGLQPYRVGQQDDPGKVSVWYVGIDDWVQDMTAKTPSEWGFCGHRYRIPLARLLADDTIPHERRLRINQTERRPYNEFGNLKVEALSEGTRFPYPWKQYVDCWEIFLPEEKQVLTFVGNEGSAMFDPDPIKVVKWEGPLSGPYHVIQFHDVLDNPLSLPPVELYHDLSVSLNIIINKIIRQAQGMKRNLIFQKSTNAGDIQAYNDAKDGQGVALDNPNAAKEVTVGGPDQGMMALGVQLRNLFSLQAGNIDQLAGLQSQAPTAQQEKMLAESSSFLLSAMQSRAVTWMSAIFQDAAFWLFSDPHLSIPTQRPLGNTGMQMPFVMTHDLVQGHEEDYSIEIAPYSHVYKTPQERLQTLMSMMNSLLPMMEAAGQGAPIDIEYLVKLFSRYGDLPELEQVYQSPLPSQDAQQDQASDDSPTQGAQNKTTTHIRADRGNNGPAQQETQMVQMLQGMNSGGSSANGQAA